MNLPAQSGTYALILQADAVRTIQVGKLGSMRVQPGFYAYVGSAFGPGGLRGRVERHWREEKILHWHIDFLRQVTSIIEVWADSSPQRQEHAWAQAFQAVPGSTIPLHRFGASDCRCEAHLFYWVSRPALATWALSLPVAPVRYDCPGPGR